MNVVRGIPESVGDKKDENPKLLPILATKVAGYTLANLLDTASDSTFILESTAKKLKLKGRKETTWLLSTNQETPSKITLSRYEVPVPKPDGSFHVLSCLCLPRITKNASRNINIEKAYEIFPDVPKGALERVSTEEIDILIGQDYTALLPYGGEGDCLQGNLRLMKCDLGSGWVIAGSHPELQITCTHFDSEIEKMRSAMFTCSPKTVNHARPPDQALVGHKQTQHLKIRGRVELNIRKAFKKENFTYAGEPEVETLLAGENSIEEQSSEAGCLPDVRHCAPAVCLILSSLLQHLADRPLISV